MTSFLLLLIAFCFYKATDACFQLKTARYYSLKRQATSALLKKQNTISPNARVGLKDESLEPSGVLFLLF